MASTGAVIVVDNEEAERLMAEHAGRQSQLPNRLITLSSGFALVEHLNEVQDGIHRMPLVVLLDIHMPGMSGFETLERIRTNPALSTDPPIFIVSNSANPNHHEAAKALAAPFLPRPRGIPAYAAFLDTLPRLVEGLGSRSPASSHGLPLRPADCL